MAVDPTKPGSSYKGHDFQEWQRLQPKPAPPPKLPPIVWTSSAPNYPVLQNPFPRGNSLPDPPAYGGSTSGNFGSVAQGPGISEALGQKSAHLAGAVVKRVWPLQACSDLGARIAGAGRGVRIWLAILCAIPAAGLAANAGWEGVALLAAVVGGGALGWALPTVLGMVLALAAHLTGLALGLSFFALIIFALYLLAKAFMT